MVFGFKLAFLKSGARHLIERAGWLVLAGLGVLFVALLGQFLFVPPPFDIPFRIVYRCIFIVSLPLQFIVGLALPSRGHHWPLLHFLLAYTGLPLFWWTIIAISRRTYRRIMGAIAALTGRKPQRHSEPESPSRRDFLMRTAGGAAGVVAGGLGMHASLIAPGDLELRKYDIPIKDLPSELDGVRLVHISDTHYGPFTGREFLGEVIAEANSLKGDLVVLTGDYVHYTPRSIDEGIELLAGFEGRLGSVAVMGNHEHWEGIDACRKAFQRIGVPILDNSRTFLTSGGLADTPIPGKTLCLGGVGDYWEDVVRFDKALDGVPEDMPRVVLSHNPDAAEMAGDRRVDLILAGHTHGGQVCLPIIGAPVANSQFGQKYIGGLCRGPKGPVVVSRGIGLAFIPIRINVPPEVVLVTLKRSPA